MNIYITGLGSGYEVEHLVRLFYPMAPLTLTPPEDGADCVWAEKRPDKLWAMVRQGGKSQTAEAPLPIPVEEGGETPEFALASLTYDLLRSWTGIRPPWGKMTGVRPVRLVHDKRAAGWTEEEIDDFFLKRFDCSPEKYGMAKAIADLQEPILKVGSAPKTYSLYIGIPFCPSRCSYCSFVSCNLDRDRKMVQPYVDCLCNEVEEIRRQADKAGLKIGDKILSIDGKDAKGFTTEQVSSRLKGEPGSKVKVTVEHLDGTQQTAAIRRERIAIPGVPYAGWVADGIGYIRHSDFTEGCYEEMRAAIERLRTEKPLKGLVLDYRSNGGGIMQEAVKILGMFVPKGTEVVSTKGRSEDSKQVFRTDTEPILADLPLTVLINGNSASSAEIVAGALQDLDRAVLIGQRSFGKGLVQSPRPLGYNAMLKLTTAKYYIPSGRCIQAIDYSHSQEGSVRAVPDSLISEFTTRAGRKVYDGGGVMPDIATDPEYISRFALTLYALGFIEDFGDEYTRRNPGRQIDIRTFSITDKDYADFAEFMQDKKVPYESDTRRALKALKKAAEDDRFADLKNKFEQVEAELKDDTQTNLETYRTQVVETINNDIVMRHGYQAGVIEHSLSGDKEVKKAVEVLGDPAEYARITREQDTKRK